MPTATVDVNIIGVASGVWAIVLTIKVNGQVPPQATTRVWAELAETGGAIIKPTTPADVNGKITWDGAIAGSWSDLFPRKVTVFTHFRGEDGIEYKKDVNLNLGYDNWGLASLSGMAKGNRIYELHPVAQAYLQKKR